MEQTETVIDAVEGAVMEKAEEIIDQASGGSEN
jgi:hypothetical protein